MADRSESLRRCSWSRNDAGFCLWVRARPELRGEGRDYQEALDALTEAVMGTVENIDDVLPFVPLFDRPLRGEVAPGLLEPELYQLIGDSFAHPHRIPYPSEHPLTAYFDGGLCKECNRPLGPRTDVSLLLTDAWPFDIGFLVATDGLRGWITLVSPRFLDQLDDRERAILRPREVRWDTRSRRHLFELLPIPAQEFVGEGSGVCEACGGYGPQPSKIADIAAPPWQPNMFVRRDQLPSPLPPLFAVGDHACAYPVVTRARLDRFLAGPTLREFSYRPLGVVAPT